MNEAMTNLARRAVACPAWRWLPGMLATHSQCAPARVLSVQTGEYEPPMLEIAWSWRNGDGVHPRNWLPDLTDLATLACLLAIVREATGEPHAFVEVRQAGEQSYRACLRAPVGLTGGWQFLEWWHASQDPTAADARVLVAALESASAEVD